MQDIAIKGQDRTTSGERIVELASSVSMSHLEIGAATSFSACNLSKSKFELQVSVKQVRIIDMPWF
jgi:hypothetical protein